MNDFPKDQPLDAIVEDNAAARVTSGESADARQLLPANWDEADGQRTLWGFQPPTPAQYMVPKRFGMSAILGIMTALALLFGAFRLLNAPPGVYLFFGVQTLVICVAQMLNGKYPRLASSIAGAVLVPVFVTPILIDAMKRAPILIAGTQLWGDMGVVVAVFAVLIFGIPIGAFLGYLTGTCAAGIFLVMDYLEPYLQWRGHSSHSTSP